MRGSDTLGPVPCVLGASAQWEGGACCSVAISSGRHACGCWGTQRGLFLRRDREKGAPALGASPAVSRVEIKLLSKSCFGFRNIPTTLSPEKAAKGKREESVDENPPFSFIRAAL